MWAGLIHSWANLVQSQRGAGHGVVPKRDLVVLVSARSHPGDPAWHYCRPSSELIFLCCLLQGWCIIRSSHSDPTHHMFSA